MLQVHEGEDTVLVKRRAKQIQNQSEFLAMYQSKLLKPVYLSAPTKAAHQKQRRKPIWSCQELLRLISFYSEQNDQLDGKKEGGKNLKK